VASIPGLQGPPALRVLFWGTYDLGKPRNRILLQGLRENGVEVEECHHSIWEDVRDKGILAPWRVAGRMLRAGLAYPSLVLRFWKSPAPDVVIVGYLGQLDVLLLSPFARLRGVPVVWDQFISLYDTVVQDRRRLSRSHPLARALYAWEWAACRAADCVLMDTQAHAAYIAETFGLRRERVASVWVGAEVSAFPARRRSGGAGIWTVLFYGQLIPLHGVETILRAARLLRDRPIRFVLIGSGQDEPLVRRLLAEEPLSNLEWQPWVEYERLIDSIGDADVCLGIFGGTDKASRVIPNKIFQAVAANRPLITRDSPAIRELLRGDIDGVRLVPPADAQALADALVSMFDSRPITLGTHALNLREEISPKAVGRQLLGVLSRFTGRAPPRG
jgi:glycosyltransferase involved in cell wall biosynthesis